MGSSSSYVHDWSALAETCIFFPSRRVISFHFCNLFSHFFKDLQAILKVNFVVFMQRLLVPQILMHEELHLFLNPVSVCSFLSFFLYLQWWRYCRFSTSNLFHYFLGTKLAKYLFLRHFCPREIFLPAQIVEFISLGAVSFHIRSKAGIIDGNQD